MDVVTAGAEIDMPYTNSNKHTLQLIVFDHFLYILKSGSMCSDSS